MFVYYDGKIVDVADARIGVFDGGWLHGAGLFETMRAENGRVFQLGAHIYRLRQSAKVLLKPIPRENLPDDADFVELLDRNNLKTARVRLTVTAGSMQPDLDEDAHELTVVATTSALSAPPPSVYQEGIPVVVTAFRQSADDPVAGHKTTAFLPRLLGLREAQRAKCMEALWFTTKNQLAEGSITNVFLVSAGVIKTPPIETPVLPGITRATILELAAELDMKTEECALTIDDLLDADEVFLTNSIMHVMPVVHVEKHDIADGRVGSVSKALLEAYRALVKKECGGR